MVSVREGELIVELGPVPVYAPIPIVPNQLPRII